MNRGWTWWMLAALLGAARLGAQADYDTAGRKPVQGRAGATDRRPAWRSPLVPGEVIEALRGFESRHGKAVSVFRAGSPFPRALHGFLFQSSGLPPSGPDGVAPGAARARALAFVESEGAVLGLVEPGSALEVSGVHSMEGLTIVRLEQYHEGLPVLGSGLALHIDRSGAVCAALPRIARGLPPSIDRAISAGEAFRAADTRLSSGAALPSSRPISSRPAMARIGTRYRVVWDLILATALGPYRVLVDAISGEVLGNGSLLSAVDCSPRPEGLVYPENPIQGDPVPAILDDLQCSSPYLMGEFVRSFDWGGTDFFGEPIPVLGIRGTLVNGRMVFDPTSSSDLAEVNVYHHATSFHRWFGTVGFHGLDRPFPAITNVLECYGEFPCANALYNPFFEHATGLGGILLGVGSGVNFGLESDVICHEYTHAVVAGTSNLGADYFDPSSFYSMSLNEAFADYFASSYLGDPRMGEYAGRAFGQVPIRDLDNSMRWPGDIDTFSFHDTSQIWSGALWSVRQALSAGGTDGVAILRLDRLAYAALVSLSSSAGFLDAADALIASAGSLGFSAAEILTIESILSDRGLHSSTGENPPEIRRLTPGTDALGQVAGGAGGSVRLGTVQYEIVVPPEAARLRIAIEGTGNLDLHARHGAPVTIAGGSVVATAASEGPSSSETLSLERSGLLVPGSWFVAISNGAPQIGDYTLEVELEISSFETIVPLPPGSSADGNLASGPALAPLAYAIPAGQIEGKKLVITLDADAASDLYLRRGRPVELGLEGQIVADIRVATSDLGKRLVLDSLTVPALESIPYYAAVWNAAPGPIAYTVAAVLEDAPAPDPRQIPLQSGVPLSGTVQEATPGMGSLSEVQFTVLVGEDGSRMAVEATSASDVGIFIRRGGRVAYEDGALAHDHGSDLPRSGEESVVIDLFSRPRLESGLYHIAISNRSAGPAEFEVRVDIEDSPAPAVLQGLPSDVWTQTTAEAAAAAGSGKLASVQFQVVIPEGAPGLDVITLPGSAGDLDLYLRRNRPVQMIDGRVVADYHAETAEGAETLVVFERDLIPGIYHIGIVNRSTSAIPLEIVAAYEGAYAASVLVDDDDIWEGAIGARPTACSLFFFQFAVDVPPTALRLEVDVKPLGSGPIQILQRFGSRVAIDHVGRIIFDRNTLTTDGLIVYTGADLRPGIHFFALANCTRVEQAFELTMYMKVAGAPEEYIESDEERLGTADPALEAPSELHPTQIFFFAGPDRKEAVISVWGPECEDSGLDLLANPGSRITLEADGTTNAALRASGRGPVDTIVINSESTPPFAPGKHYVALQNNTAEPRPFRALAVLMPAESAQLAPGEPFIGTIDTTGSPGVGLLQAEQYRIQVPPGTGAFDVELRPTGAPTADIDLHARLGAPIRLFTQGPLEADWSSTNRDSGVEALHFAADTHCIGGTYFFAIANFAPTPVEFSLVVTTDGAAPAAIPGDADEDGTLNITDAVATLVFLFSGGRTLCVEAANADGDDELNITDPIYVLSYLFLGGPEPQAPYPECAPLIAVGDCTGDGCD